MEEPGKTGLAGHGRKRRDAIRRKHERGVDLAAPEGAEKALAELRQESPPAWYPHDPFTLSGLACPRSFRGLKPAGGR